MIVGAPRLFYNCVCDHNGPTILIKSLKIPQTLPKRSDNCHLINMFAPLGIPRDSNVEVIGTIGIPEASNKGSPGLLFEHLQRGEGGWFGGSLGEPSGGLGHLGSSLVWIPKRE